MKTGEISRSDGNPRGIAGKIRDRFDREKVSSLQYKTGSCIFRVPKLIREVNKDAYTPLVVSIGPYHRMDERLHSMEPYKLRYLDSLLELSKGDKTKSDLFLESCEKKILEEEDRIRRSYGDPISLSQDDFVQMVLLDSFFIIGFLKNDESFVQVQFFEIRRDLLLLENQLPFFIIDEIYDILYPSIEGTNATSFIDVASNFFRHLIYATLHWDNYVCVHLMDMVRNSYVGSFQSCRNEQGKDILTTISPTASHLHAAGVKFKVVDHTNKEGLMNIKFDKHEGVLTIPKLVCDDDIQYIFRNVLALEHCMFFYNKPSYMTDYLCFMDCLINTKEDVQLLVDRCIIESCLGSNDVICDMFNTITKNMSITRSDYVYNGICEDLNNHCSKKWNKWIAMLKNTYFAHPWAGISVAYAIILLLLTIAQVVLAIVALP